MSEVLASYIDSLFDAAKEVSQPGAETAQDTITITPVYVMGLTLAILSSSIAEVIPLRVTKRRTLAGYSDEMDDETSVIATAQWIVPAAHPLYASACHYDGYSLELRLHDRTTRLACDAVGCDVTLQRSTGNWRSEIDPLESNPHWLLATFPQYGYALISPAHLLDTVR